MQHMLNAYINTALKPAFITGFKSVSNNNYRTYNQHITQTGLSINSNLYIAIGISCAIKHIAVLTVKEYKASF